MAANNTNLTLACLEKLVHRLNTENNSCPVGLEVLEGTLDVNLQHLLEEISNEFNIPTLAALGDSADFRGDIRWQFIDLACSLLLRLCDELTETDLSLTNQTIVKDSVLWVVVLGVVPSLVKSVAVIVKDAVKFPNPHTTHDLSNIQKYKRLCAVMNVLLKCLEHSALRSLILNYLGCILTALCQLAYAPLKKPSSDKSKGEISQELYDMFCNDQIYYQNILDRVTTSIYQPRVIQELMLILGSQKDKVQPLWLKKSCSRILTQLLLAPGGVSAVIRSTMESSIDTGTDWKTVTILTKIITSPQQHYANICSQITQLLESSNTSKSCSEVGIACVNELLVKDPVIAHTAIIDKLLKPLTCLSFVEIKNFNYPGNVIIPEENFTLYLEHLHQYFTVKLSSSNSSYLPSHLLCPVSHILFQLYGNIRESVSHVTSLVADLLFCILSDCSSCMLNTIIRTVVFKEHSDSILNPGDMLFVLGPNSGIQVEKVKDIQRGVEYSAVEQAGDILFSLLDKKDSDGTLSFSVFVILIQILLDFGVVPQNLESCENILGTVEDTIGELVVRSEKHVGAVRLLAALSENKIVQNKLSQKPDCIVGFLEILLQQEVQNSANYGKNNHFDEADILCVALMILEVIIGGNRHDVNWDSLKTLIPLMKKLKNLAVNPELQNLADHIYNSLVTKGVMTQEPREQSNEKPACEGKKSDCDKAFEDSCDPLLPVRGHALVKLTELINSRDRQAIAKKDAILCLFQENLKNEDTFIYLAAINGMAALTSYFPDTVLSTLTEEFILATSSGKDESDENLTRMKLGEVLIKVTRLLGEIASKFKSQLLNAFLVGVKDVDPLVRASSLSNLGEACRILGFRIGPILQEILICIRDVSSDKAVEPRRAAVMVITLLLQGLNKDALKVLSNDILLLYRALRDLCQRETDCATKLHAELALDEIDNIARPLFAESRLKKNLYVLAYQRISPFLR